MTTIIKIRSSKLKISDTYKVNIKEDFMEQSNKKTVYTHLSEIPVNPTDFVGKIMDVRATDKNVNIISKFLPYTYNVSVHIDNRYILLMFNGVDYEKIRSTIKKLRKDNNSEILLKYYRPIGIQW